MFASHSISNKGVTHTPVTNRVAQWALLAAISGVATSAYAAQSAASLSEAHIAEQSSVIADHSQQKATTARLIELARQKDLASHPTWLRLHFYEEDGSGEQKQYRSSVDNQDFFLSTQGKNDPQAELEAFIKAAMTQSGDDDSRAVCRFPARAHWLKEQLGLENVDSNCPDFDAWMQKLDPQRLSVVFAEEYPNRAVSAFGHTLMLIDSTESLADPSAIDKAHALNDSVAGDPDDAAAVYALKSATGGYPNDITIEPYSVKLADYLQKDSRDVWTYALQLSNAEVQQIMRHVYESKDLELPYYFTMDNCASEILRYIDIVRPEGSLLDEFKVAVVPSDVVRLLKKEGLINESNYLPADKTLAQAKLNNPQLTDLPTSSITPEHKLVFTDLVPTDNNPLNAHSLQRVMVGAGAQDDTGYLSLAYRGGFNDFLDSPSGYPQNFHLEAGSIELRAYADDDKDKGNHNRVELQDLTLFRGRVFNPINTEKRGGSLLSSWGVNVHATRVKDGSQAGMSHYDNDSGHLVGSVGYEKGVSAAFGTPTAGSGELPPHLCYAFGTGAAQVGKGLGKGYRVGAGVNVGCRYQFSRNARLVGEVEAPYWFHGDMDSDQGKDHYWQPILSLGAQYDMGQNQAIRLKGSYELQDRIDGRDDVQLAYVKYF